MKVLINGEEIEIEKVSYNHGMNYGQFHFKALEIDDYELILTKEEFVQAIESSYYRVREDIRADDIACNEESEFSRTGYVSLEKMFSYPAELESVISTYLDRGFFEKVLPLHIEQGYIINSTDVVTVSDETVSIKGRTYCWPFNK
jgi:hypothetical protein